MTLFQRTLLFAAVFISFQMVPCLFTSFAIDLLQVVLGLPVFLVPCGFQSKACHMTLLVCFRRVCPIHVHFLLAISLLMPCWSVLLQISLFVVLSCHFVFRMYLRHLLMNVCSIRVVVLVTLHVSEPYSSALFTLVLKILILFCVEKDDVFHTVFKMLIFICSFFVCHYTSQRCEFVVLLYIFSLQLYLSRASYLKTTGER